MARRSVSKVQGHLATAKKDLEETRESLRKTKALLDDALRGREDAEAHITDLRERINKLNEQVRTWSGRYLEVLAHLEELQGAFERAINGLNLISDYSCPAAEAVYTFLTKAKDIAKDTRNAGGRKS